MWTLLAPLHCEKDCKYACLSVLVGVYEYLCMPTVSCYGTWFDLSPHVNTNLSLYPNPRFKSEPSSSPDTIMSQLSPSQLSSSSQNLWSKSQSPPTDHRSNTNIPSTISQVTSSSNTRLRLQPLSKQGSNSRQGLTLKSNSNQLAKSNNTKQSSKINSKTNPKPMLGSLPWTKAKVLPNSKAVTGSKSVSLSNTKLSSIFSPKPWSNSSGSMSIYSNISLASLFNLKSHSKFQPSSQANPNIRSKSKTSNLNTKTSIRTQKNQTKLLDTDKDLHQRPKRGWIWNQFFILEEHIGPEPQYVGKHLSHSVTRILLRFPARRNAGDCVPSISLTAQKLFGRGGKRAGVVIDRDHEPRWMSKSTSDGFGSALLLNSSKSLTFLHCGRSEVRKNIHWAPILHSNSDKGDGSVRYILSGEGAGSIFTIDETTGDIQAAQSLDREKKAQYVVHARAIDRWTNRSLETESEFIIKVQDVNDNAPTFPHGPFTATVPEMSDVAARAAGADCSGSPNVGCGVQKPPGEPPSWRGHTSLAQGVSHLNIREADTDIAEKDANLHTPESFKSFVWKYFGFRKNEKQLVKDVAICKECRRTSVFEVTASDADDTTYGNSAKIVYSIVEGQSYFSVDPKTGIIRTAMSSMDRETRDHYAVVIQAKDMAGSVGGLSGSTTVNITLTDVNDNPPKFPQRSDLFKMVLIPRSYFLYYSMKRNKHYTLHDALEAIMGDDSEFEGCDDSSDEHPDDPLYNPSSQDRESDESTPLVLNLLQRKIYFVGTLRANRLAACQLEDEKSLAKTGRGSVDSRVEKEESMVIVKWYDNKSVILISSYCGVEPQDNAQRWSKADKAFVEAQRGRPSLSATSPPPPLPKRIRVGVPDDVRTDQVAHWPVCQTWPLQTLRNQCNHHSV
ncbi:hypothetical protein PAMA_005592 [Pampus argenteus]